MMKCFDSAQHDSGLLSITAFDNTLAAARSAKTFVILSGVEGRWAN